MSPDLSPLSFRELMPLFHESFFCLGYLFTDLSTYSNLYLISTYYVSIILLGSENEQDETPAMCCLCSNGGEGENTVF